MYTEIMQYITLVGDLKHSRHATDRKALQELLVRTMTQVNGRYSDCFAARLMVNAGDAFQGVLYPHAPHLEICDMIRFSLVGSCDVRMALGFGSIETEIDYNSSILADGPAFWNARTTLEQIKKDDYYGIRSLAIHLGDSNLSDYESLINQTLLVQDVVCAKWKNTQIRVANHYIVNHGYRRISQKQIAQELGITIQQVNSTVKAMGFGAFLDTRRETQRVLTSLIAGDKR